MMLINSNKKLKNNIINEVGLYWKIPKNIKNNNKEYKKYLIEIYNTIY